MVRSVTNGDIHGYWELGRKSLSCWGGYAGCGEECERLRHEVGRLQHELHSLLQRYQEQRGLLAQAREEVR